MESLSRPFHRRKLSNANTFSAKNAYDGVFSGHRPRFDGAPPVNVNDYCEIFGSGQTSIPVLDLSSLEESSDALEVRSTKPDYGKIFGGFRDEDNAVSYEQLLVRDKARSPSSSQDLGDVSLESPNALKQFNMSYNKISQRSNDALDRTTHVAQLHATPGFTCFIEETASQPKKETEKPKSSLSNNVSIPPEKETSETPLPDERYFTSSTNEETASQPKKETEKQKSSLTNTVSIPPEKETSEIPLPDERYFKKESSSTNKETASQPKKETEKQKTSLTNTVSIPPEKETSEIPLPDERYFKKESSSTNEDTASQPKKETEQKKFSLTNNVNIPPEKETSEIPLPDDRYFKKESSSTNEETASQPKEETENKKSCLPDVKNSIKGDFLEKQTSENAVECNHKVESLSDDIKSSVSSSHEANYDKDDQKRSDFFSACFDEELDVNSAAATSAAALRKAIEKAQESIRIAKESVGRKKQGLRSFSSKSFKDSLKVKTRVANEKDLKEKDNKIKETFERTGATTSEISKDGGKTVSFPVSADGEKLSVVKKAIDEIHEKITESAKISEINIHSEQVAGETEALGLDSVVKYEFANGLFKRFENNKYEAPQEDNQRPNGFLVLESREKNLRDTFKDETDLKENNYDVKPSTSDKLPEQFKNLTLYQKVEEEKKISQDDSDQNDYHGNETVELLENKLLEQERDEKLASEKVGEDEIEPKEDNFYDVSELEIIKNEVSPKEKESQKLDEFEIYENLSSSDYDDAEESESMHSCNGVSQDDSKLYQSDNDVESRIHEVDVEVVEISNEFQVEEETEPIEHSEEKKEIFENVPTDDTACKENEDETDCRFGENESSSDLEMEMEVKEYKEREEMIKESNLQQSQEAAIKEEQEQERERNRLAVERAIREARERAFAEARERAAVQRATAEVRERVMAKTKSSSAESKIRAERAAVERATSEARQRALEKAMSQNKTQHQTSSSDIHSSNGVTTESALRSKAKLEKHNRIMERAAKALAEKEKRDLLAQKEQAERSRLAENLDADIKRWSSGKEGNLRALLSTLQYILGGESGWQPISLTEIITSSAVKKAYRKATLCVHPDKLQQRGASIQHKYICEKVFDLLKAAWNRFNSEER